MRAGSFRDVFDRCTCFLIVLSAVVSAISIGIVIAQSLQATLLVREETSIRVSHLIAEAVEAQFDEALSGPTIDVSLHLVQAADSANFSRLGMDHANSLQTTHRRSVPEFGAVSTLDLLADLSGSIPKARLAQIAFTDGRFMAVGFFSTSVYGSAGLGSNGLGAAVVANAGDDLAIFGPADTLEAVRNATSNTSLSGSVGTVSSFDPRALPWYRLAMRAARELDANTTGGGAAVAASIPDAVMWQPLHELSAPQQTVTGASTTRGLTAAIALRHPDTGVVEAVLGVDVHVGTSLSETMRDIASFLHQEGMRVHISLLDVFSNCVVSTSTSVGEAAIPGPDCGEPDARVVSEDIQLRVLGEARVVVAELIRRANETAAMLDPPDRGAYRVPYTLGETHNFPPGVLLSPVFTVPGGAMEPPETAPLAGALDVLWRSGVRNRGLPGDPALSVPDAIREHEAVDRALLRPDLARGEATYHVNTDVLRLPPLATMAVIIAIDERDVGKVAAVEGLVISAVVAFLLAAVVSVAVAFANVRRTQLKLKKLFEGMTMGGVALDEQDGDISGVGGGFGGGSDTKLGAGRRGTRASDALLGDYDRAGSIDVTDPEPISRPGGCVACGCCGRVGVGGDGEGGRAEASPTGKRLRFGETTRISVAHTRSKVVPMSDRDGDGGATSRNDSDSDGGDDDAQRHADAELDAELDLEDLVDPNAIDADTAPIPMALRVLRRMRRALPLDRATLAYVRKLTELLKRAGDGAYLPAEFEAVLGSVTTAAERYDSGAQGHLGELSEEEERRAVAAAATADPSPPSALTLRSKTAPSPRANAARAHEGFGGRGGFGNRRSGTPDSERAGSTVGVPMGVLVPGPANRPSVVTSPHVIGGSDASQGSLVLSATANASHRGAKSDGHVMDSPFASRATLQSRQAAVADVTRSMLSATLAPRSSHLQAQRRAAARSSAMRRGRSPVAALSGPRSSQASTSQFSTTESVGGSGGGGGRFPQLGVSALPMSALAGARKQRGFRPMMTIGVGDIRSHALRAAAASGVGFGRGSARQAAGTAEGVHGGTSSTRGTRTWAELNASTGPTFGRDSAHGLPGGLHDSHSAPRTVNGPGTSDGGGSGPDGSEGRLVKPGRLATVKTAGAATWTSSRLNGSNNSGEMSIVEMSRMARAALPEEGRLGSGGGQGQQQQQGHQAGPSSSSSSPRDGVEVSRGGDATGGRPPIEVAGDEQGGPSKRWGSQRRSSEAEAPTTGSAGAVQLVGSATTPASHDGAVARFGRAGFKGAGGLDVDRADSEASGSIVERSLFASTPQSGAAPNADSGSPDTGQDAKPPSSGGSAAALAASSSPGSSGRPLVRAGKSVRIMDTLAESSTLGGSFGNSSTTTSSALTSKVGVDQSPTLEPKPGDAVPVLRGVSGRALVPTPAYSPTEDVTGGIDGITELSDDDEEDDGEDDGEAASTHSHEDGSNGRQRPRSNASSTNRIGRELSGGRVDLTDPHTSASAPSSQQQQDDEQGEGTGTGRPGSDMTVMGSTRHGHGPRAALPDSDGAVALLASGSAMSDEGSLDHLNSDRIIGSFLPPPLCAAVRDATSLTAPTVLFTPRLVAAQRVIQVWLYRGAYLPLAERLDEGLTTVMMRAAYDGPGFAAKRLLQPTHGGGGGGQSQGVGVAAAPGGGRTPQGVGEGSGGGGASSGASYGGATAAAVAMRASGMDGSGRGSVHLFADPPVAAVDAAAAAVGAGPSTQGSSAGAMAVAMALDATGRRDSAVAATSMFGGSLTAADSGNGSGNGHEASHSLVIAASSGTDDDTLLGAQMRHQAHSGVAAADQDTSEQPTMADLERGASNVSMLPSPAATVITAATASRGGSGGEEDLQRAKTAGSAPAHDIHSPAPAGGTASTTAPSTARGAEGDGGGSSGGGGGGGGSWHRGEETSGYGQAAEAVAAAMADTPGSKGSVASSAGVGGSAEGGSGRRRYSSDRLRPGSILTGSGDAVGIGHESGDAIETPAGVTARSEVVGAFASPAVSPGVRRGSGFDEAAQHGNNNNNSNRGGDGDGNYDEAATRKDPRDALLLRPKQHTPPTLSTLPAVWEAAGRSLNRWSWNVFGFVDKYCHSNFLPAVGIATLRSWKTLDALHVPEWTVGLYLASVERGYRSAPYHNALHATDATHSMTFLLNSKRFDCLTDVERLAGVVAPAVHDLAHPGFNTAYLASTSSRMAVRYNDTSPLEAFHCAAAFELATALGDSNPLRFLEASDREYVRGLIIEIVLGTDMARSMELTSKFVTSVYETDTEWKRIKRRAADSEVRRMDMDARLLRGLTSRRHVRALLPLSLLAARLGGSQLHLEQLAGTDATEIGAETGTGSETGAGHGSAQPAAPTASATGSDIGDGGAAAGAAGDDGDDASSLVKRGSDSMSLAADRHTRVTSQSRDNRSMAASIATSGSNYRDVMGNVVIPPIHNVTAALVFTMKCADIGHCCKPFDQHTEWSRRVVVEFCLQGRRETLAGGSPPPFMDEANLHATHNSQAGFLGFVAVPLWKKLSEWLPEAEDPLALAQGNKDIWDSLSFDAEDVEKRSREMAESEVNAKKALVRAVHNELQAHDDGGMPRGGAAESSQRGAHARQGAAEREAADGGAVSASIGASMAIEDEDLHTFVAATMAMYVDQARKRRVAVLGEHAAGMTGHSAQVG